jgi:hypothetical protein
LARTEAELDRLAAAVAEGGTLTTLLGAIQARERDRDRLRAELRALHAQIGRGPRDRKATERRLREMLSDWRGLLDKQVGEARHVLGALLTDRLVFTPTTDAKGVPCYQVRWTFALGRVLSGIIRSQGGTSPAGIASSWTFDAQRRLTWAA